jgi:hypothetical protein
MERLSTIGDGLAEIRGRRKYTFKVRVGSKTEVNCALLHVHCIPMIRHHQLSSSAPASQIFSSQDWTAPIRLNRFEKFVSASKA